MWSIMPLRSQKYEKDRQTYAKPLRTRQDNLWLNHPKMNQINNYKIKLNKSHMLFKRRKQNIYPPHMKGWASKTLNTSQSRRLVHQGIKASRLRIHSVESLISLQIQETH